MAALLSLRAKAHLDLNMLRCNCLSELSVCLFLVSLDTYLTETHIYTQKGNYQQSQGKQFTRLVGYLTTSLTTGTANQRGKDRLFCQ